MDAWGIIMPAFTMLGMVVLVVANLTTEGTSATTSMQPPVETALAASDVEEAA